MKQATSQNHQAYAYPEHADTLEAALAETTRLAQSEPGCIHYSIARDDEDSTVFYVFERYSSRRAFEQHMQHPAAQKVLTYSRGIKANPFMLEIWEELLSAYGPGSFFFLFAQLPVELRLTIWDLNLPRLRVVPIRCCHGASTSDEDQRDIECSDGHQFSQCTSSAPISVNLHVCREARLEAMKRYKLMFGEARSRDGNAASAA
ncbi:hypothetical protein F4809DRAFT_640339 [Biscogniauxia mediterranea]|nr:hypothetical protein F4809DRAFT_640339 [Biscogniauxia mediterranea]